MVRAVSSKILGEIYYPLLSAVFICSVIGTQGLAVESGVSLFLGTVKSVRYMSLPQINKYL